MNILKSVCHLTDLIMCLKAPTCLEEKVHCCVCWVAHSAPGYSAAVTLSLNSGSSLSDFDECVGDLKRLPPAPQLSEKSRPWPLADRPQTDQVQGRHSHLSQVHTKQHKKHNRIQKKFFSQDSKIVKIFLFCYYSWHCLFVFPPHIYINFSQQMTGLFNFLSCAVQPMCTVNGAFGFISPSILTWKHQKFQDSTPVDSKSRYEQSGGATSLFAPDWH